MSWSVAQSCDSFSVQRFFQYTKFLQCNEPLDSHGNTCFLWEAGMDEAEQGSLQLYVTSEYV